MKIKFLQILHKVKYDSFFLKHNWFLFLLID
jgi:hypothetical protein